MLLLLPPSEGKALGGAGPPLDLAGLSFSSLASVRRTLVAAVVRLARRQPAALRAALGLSERQRGEVGDNAALRTSATLPAIERYTGVVYDQLGYASLPAAARHRADETLLVSSALFGLLRPTDSIPRYRLPAGTALPGLPALAALWRPALEPVLAGTGGLVVDLRSGAYASLARMPTAIQVRVLRDVDGHRTVVSHDNKYTKGRLARQLLLHGAQTVADVAAAGREVADAVELEGSRLDLVLRGLASAR
ncbi:MAG: peroxide stress protein YaaA [Actinomycetota bacterium]|nr:peroxide stress protein YaaA [Actinomycetota bacterium]